MVITEKKASLWRYCIPFKRQGVVEPARFGDQGVTYRSGLVVELWQSGRQSLAEIAPLPGYSQESLTQATVQAKRQLSLWVQHQPMLFERLYPSVAFGLSMALHEGKQPYSRLHLGETARLIGSDELGYPQEVQCQCGGLSTPCEASVARQDHSVVGCAKIKLGRQPLVVDIERVKAALNHVSVLRIDVNRSWSLDEVMTFSHAFNPSQREQIEWVEEPCTRLADSIQFARQTGWPLALDESLHGQKPSRQSRWVSALVLKPTLIGSLDRCRQWADLANQHQQKWMLSSSLESSLGLNQIARLSEQWQAPAVAGLDTFDRFNHQVIRPWPLCEKPVLALEKLEKIWTSTVV